MTNVIGVRFKQVGKVYYFDPGALDCPLGAGVIVETARGVELGEVVMPLKQVEDDALVAPLKTVLRIATEEDRKRIADNAIREKEAFRICEQKIAEHKLDMKLVDVEYTFDNNKILFYFTAEGRVDFRELVKDLASVFRTRIELRQIGVRDEAKMLGGLGICGRPFCCSSFLGEFAPVSIKMAKEQGLSLNPTKISGTCGRLMCCLKYEQPAYEDLIRHMPKVGAVVDTRDGRGVVTAVNLLRRMVSVRLDGSSDTLPAEYPAAELRIVHGERGKSGEIPEVVEPEESSAALSDEPSFAPADSSADPVLSGGQQDSASSAGEHPAERQKCGERRSRGRRGGERRSSKKSGEQKSGASSAGEHTPSDPGQAKPAKERTVKERARSGEHRVQRQVQPQQAAPAKAHLSDRELLEQHMRAGGQRPAPARREPEQDGRGAAKPAPQGGKAHLSDREKFLRSQPQSSAAEKK